MRYRLSPEVLRASLQSEQVLLNKTTGQYHAISGVGPALLDALEDGAALDAACQELAFRTGHELDAVRSDCEAFVAQMIERALIEEVAE
jgi:hypothetical protein